ncbi:hypothetical protein MHAS_03419 [Mycolicibacterium hassiacum DSM 44199]|nr:hypothetical protein [Mycolicibacterium hassiacum DSM 44199]VCT91700.1 hypothetical protein MHAS_03419 [Mycolicibacterium hassiacum DSM 44199]
MAGPIEGADGTFIPLVTSPYQPRAVSVVGVMITAMRSLDDLLADIDRLEAEEDADLSPLPGETTEQFRARMLREFDALNALADDGGDPDVGWRDAWRWASAPAGPEHVVPAGPEPVVPAEPEPVVPAGPASYLIEPWEIGSILPRGGPLTTWIGGRRLGTSQRSVMADEDFPWTDAATYVQSNAKSPGKDSMRKPTAALIAAATATTTALITAPTAAATVVQCGSANGYSVSAESATTSCEFALAVARKVPAGFTGNHTSVIASSPVTGKRYEVACSRLYQRTLECKTFSTGVQIFLNS